VTVSVGSVCRIVVRDQAGVGSLRLLKSLGVLKDRAFCEYARSPNPARRVAHPDAFWQPPLPIWLLQDARTLRKTWFLLDHPCEDYQERPARAVWCCTLCILLPTLRPDESCERASSLTFSIPSESRACPSKQLSSMGVMAQHRQAPSHQFKEEPGHDSVSATFSVL